MIKLSPHERIVDEKKFIEAHTATIEANKGNKTFDVYKERLEIYKAKKNERQNTHS